MLANLLLPIPPTSAPAIVFPRGAEAEVLQNASHRITADSAADQLNEQI
jgi:hypothetical protein